MAAFQHLTEIELVDRFLSAGTEEAFSELFSIIYPQIVRYFSFRGFANDVAEEMAQDVMVAVFRKAATLRDRGLFRPWLFKVAQNTLRQHLRRTQNDPNLRPLEEAAAQLRETWGGIPENDGFLDMISVLNEDERHIMNLRYIEDLSYEEIAAVLNIPLGTVKWKLFDSKTKVCAYLRQSQAEHA
jgi:RNA polymerase sigma-70 factor (ECF subfamily)